MKYLGWCWIYVTMNNSITNEWKHKWKFYFIHYYHIQWMPWPLMKSISVNVLIIFHDSDLSSRYAKKMYMCIHTCQLWQCQNILFAILNDVTWSAYLRSLTHLPLVKMVTTLADNNFKCIFLNENDRILIRFSLKFVPMSSIDNNPASV